MPLLAALSAQRRPFLAAVLLLLVLGAHAGHGAGGHGAPEESGHGAEGAQGSLESSGGHEASGSKGHESPSEHGGSTGHGEQPASSEHGAAAKEHGGESAGHGGQAAEHGGQAAEHGRQAAEHGGQAAEHGGQAAEHGDQGGHGGGGKAHGSKGGHHVQEISAQERSIAYLMMFAVAGFMVLLFFLNYSDPDVRCASSKMACTAVSVYCAVLVNQAIFSFIFDQLLVGEGGRGFGMKKEDIKPWMHVLIGIMVFVPMLAGLNLMCYRWRDSPNRLVAASQLGAHMVAWAGINTFGSLQNSDAFHEEFMRDLQMFVGESDQVQDHEMVIKYIAVVIIGFLSFILLFGLSDRIRTKILERLGKKGKGATGKEPDGAEAAAGSQEPAQGTQPESKTGGKSVGSLMKSLGTGGGKAAGLLRNQFGRKSADKSKPPEEEEEEEEEEHWLEEVVEGEREAMALVLGFLTQQTVVYAITGRETIPIHGLHDQRELDHVILMVVSALLALVMLVWVALFHQKPKPTFINFRGFLAMTMAWLFERSGEWALRRFFNLACARIWSAFILTGFAIFATVFIEILATGSKDRRERTKYWKKAEKTEEESMSLEKYCIPDILEELVALDKYYEVVERQKKAKAPAPVAESVEAPLVDSEVTEPEKINDIPIDRLRELYKFLRDETKIDITVRAITVGFSVLIGIVWDMAFESAETIIVSPGDFASDEGKNDLPIASMQKWMIAHPVVSKNLLAFILCAIVLPGWVYFIVPPARKAWRHHLQDILLAQRQVPRQKRSYGDE